MIKKVLLVASVRSHIAQFHRPLIKVLKEEGCEIHVAARNNLAEKNGLTIKNVDRFHDIPFQRFPLDPRNLKSYFEMRKLLREEQFDLISCNTPAAGVITRIAAQDVRRRGGKVYYTAHGFHFYKGAPVQNWLLYYPIERLMAPLTDKLITITKEDYRLAKAKFSCEVDHIYGVGIDDERYYVIDRDEQKRIRKQNDAEGRFVVLCVGELNKNKNQTTVIQALKGVAERFPDVLLWLAGNGPNEENLRMEIEQSGLQDHVRLLGYRTDLEMFTASCELVVSASFREGLPLNILEGMACGKPVIASVNRGHRELLRNGYNGYLFDPHDAKALEERLIELIADPEKRNRFGRNGLKTIQRYKASNVANELRRIYFGSRSNDSITK